MPAKEYAEFTTITCLEWKPILKDNRFEKIITNSLSFLSNDNRVTVYAFVIMDNHFHLIWQMLGDTSGRMSNETFSDIRANKY